MSTTEISRQALERRALGFLNSREQKRQSLAPRFVHHHFLIGDETIGSIRGTVGSVLYPLSAQIEAVFCFK